MYRINENYLKLPGSYLFSTIGKKVSAFSAANPDKRIHPLRDRGCDAAAAGRSGGGFAQGCG